jgi:hypothetical protein
VRASQEIFVSDVSSVPDDVCELIAQSFAKILKQPVSKLLDTC